MKRILTTAALFAIVASSSLEASMQRKPTQQRQDPEQSKNFKGVVIDGGRAILKEGYTAQRVSNNRVRVINIATNEVGMALVCSCYKPGGAEPAEGRCTLKQNLNQKIENYFCDQGSCKGLCYMTRVEDLGDTAVIIDNPTEDRERPSSGARPGKGDRPLPATPCCEITAIDAAGVVTARNATTGETFQFEVESRSQLKSLQVGQKVYADMAAKKAGVKPGEPCCEITSRKQRRKE